MRVHCVVKLEIAFLLTGRIVITVDGEVIEVPLKAYPTRPDLVLEGPVDFGNVVRTQ